MGNIDQLLGCSCLKSHRIDTEQGHILPSKGFSFVSVGSIRGVVSLVSRNMMASRIERDTFSAASQFRLCDGVFGLAIELYYVHRFI